MYAFSSDPAQPKPALYRELAQSAKALISGETDTVANMANLAALLWQMLPDLNWAGFYRLIDEELVLGPFCGKPACIRIPLGRGVCGSAAQAGETHLVNNVHAFPGHIACDTASQSELVVPVKWAGRVLAVIDLDSPTLSRFDDEDQQGIEQFAQTIAPALCGMAG